MSANRGKILLAILLFVAAIALLAAFWPHSPITNTITLVCADTGEIFHISRDNVTTVPLKNPKTGERTLVPCVEEQGAYRVSSHYRQIVRDLGEKNHHVDVETLAVRGTK